MATYTVRVTVRRNNKSEVLVSTFTNRMTALSFYFEANNMDEVANVTYPDHGTKTFSKTDAALANLKTFIG